MSSYLKITNSCVQCDNCKIICPTHSIIFNTYTYFIETWSCIQCDLCIQVCPVDCIKYYEDELSLE